jgi:hypothetical protein
VILGGKCVEVSTYTSHRDGDLAGAPAFGAFEKEVFEEMGDAALGCGLVAAADSGPNPHAHAAHMRHFDRGDARAVGRRVTW